MRRTATGIAITLLCLASSAAAQVAVRGATVHTAAGETLRDAVVLVDSGRITAVGPASSVEIPPGIRTLRAKVVTPGLIDAHSTLGLSGYLNITHDQDQVEASAPVQPELRATDAYNPREPLVEWAMRYGVTTIHTGHAPRALISGQTGVFKTGARTVEEAVLKPLAMVAATLGEGARRDARKPPGTRAKMAAMLRSELIRAQEYQAKLDAGGDGRPARDLRLEALASVLRGDIPLLVTAQRSHDILTALRIRDEFGFGMVLDGAAEGYLVLDRIRASGVPVIVHPTMMRARGETENLSFGTAARLAAAGVKVALQGGFEAYVPKSRLVLFEAAVAAAHGLGREAALRSVTIDAAEILGVGDRVGSIELGKDGDLALYDGDPFEYATHCVGVVIEGVVVSEETR